MSTPAERGAALARRRISSGTIAAPYRAQAMTKDRRKASDSASTQAQELRAALRGGVRVVSAPQLFPTPPELALRMVELAGVRAGHRVLEPSAGTGRLLDALPAGCDVVAVEINAGLAGQLDATGRAVVAGDFLRCTPATLWGRFDVIVMNPPFSNGQDVAHIKHAAQFLRPGGRLVALCANGPRQQRELEPIATSYERLPPGSFASEGTGVNVALLTIDN